MKCLSRPAGRGVTRRRPTAPGRTQQRVCLLCGDEFATRRSGNRRFGRCADRALGIGRLAGRREAVALAGAYIGCPANSGEI